MRCYPEYKESDAEFIGEIPKDWNTMRCAHLFEVKHIKKTSGEINLSVYRDYGVIKRDSRDDNYNRVSEDTSNYKLVEPGDFVFNKMKCWQGSLGVSEYRGIVSPSYTVCEPKRHFHGKYFHYLLRSQPYIQEFNRLSYGVRIGQWELRFEDLKDIVIPYPPLSEQTQIVNFLDRKTGQIDELIRIKERRIELLQEQRTTLINQTVTKGLDPNVAMKPSGVEWIGEIPRDWSIIKVKYLTHQIIDGTHYTPEYQDSGIPFLRVTDIHNKTIDLTKVKYITPESHQELTQRCKPEKGNLLLSKNGTIGITRVIDWDFEFSIFVSLCLIKFRTETYSPYFFSYLFQSQVIDQQLRESSKTSTVTNLHLDKIRELFVVKPLLPAQTQIINFLDHKTEQIDELIAAEGRKIELLKEYRQSLISEAVTGKIDVRSEV